MPLCAAVSTNQDIKRLDEELQSGVHSYDERMSVIDERQLRLEVCESAGTRRRMGQQVTQALERTVRAQNERSVLHEPWVHMCMWCMKPRKSFSNRPEGEIIAENDLGECARLCRHQPRYWEPFLCLRGSASARELVPPLQAAEWRRRG